MVQPKRPKLLVLSTDSKTKKLTPTRLRVFKACIACRKKKRRCDGKSPCSHCARTSIICEYTNTARPRSHSIAFANDVSNDIHLIDSTTSSRSHSPKLSDKVNPYKTLIERLYSGASLESLQNLSREQLIKTLNSEEVNKNDTISLPPRDIALKLILKTWSSACVLFRFYHRPSLVKILDSLYELGTNPKTIKQRKAESLIFAVLAVGELFSQEENNSYSRGLNYFNKAKTLIDFKDINDIHSIQAIFMMTIFLQCSGDLKACYYYIGIALRIAIRENLHRKPSLTGPTAIEDETKKRLFWSIYKVDIYMNCTLGLPASLNESFIDQELPYDVDDEKIVSDGVIFNENSNIISSCGMNNEHTKLILIMLKIYRTLYSIDVEILKIDANVVLHLEDILFTWYNNLPLQLKHREYATNKEREYYLKPSKLLYLDYLLTKLILFKPFFHFIIIDLNSIHEKNLKFHKEMAHNCIKISIEIINLSYEMINENLLSGAYWFSIHTIFYSVACLTVYRYHLHRKMNSTSKEDETDENLSLEISRVENHYKMGYETLLKLKGSSIVSERIFNVLTTIFEEFNEKIVLLSQQVMSNLKNTLINHSVLNHQKKVSITNIHNVLNHSDDSSVVNSNEFYMDSALAKNNNLMFDPQEFLGKLLDDLNFSL
ncbi:hypothetical protein KAFR_0F01490 [Kazachstania africana CBS 2517]|uniref:Zn(2)-C6 fungal-type domain-containing protein n=1 Tax=Kazachstania africana (strain ATCC 22294 / BCRC 22015 / CBS 2517 / CECT 1963 / NBRC 1671 / NRRL Y-8276) TaxID=1071382 RepID=H2AWJ5_KAZAF|nr:hypothetical protein KAFR_0F01490 [Kazachstania africana CBS 2517]CCF58745.1 hypothetical protein KAFR_0F01490 [Kazachstania africana CBS 2517]